MAQFAEVLKETGVPQSNFMIAPQGRFNLVALVDAKGVGVVPKDGRVGVSEISDKEIHLVSKEFVAQHHLSSPDEIKARTSALWSALHGTLGSGDRVFKITAKGKGTPTIKATTKSGLTVDVALVPRTSVTLAFRFLSYPDSTGKETIRPTRWHPPDSNLWVDKLNWIYGPQTGVYFESKSPDWIKADVTLAQPLAHEAFLKYVVVKKNPQADLNVFIVGKWDGARDHPRGTTYYEHASAVVDDQPTHPEIKDISGADSFILTMAHEIAHFLRHRRKTGDGHHDRANVLLSNGVQSTRLDKQLVYDINPP